MVVDCAWVVASRERGLEGLDPGRELGRLSQSGGVPVTPDRGVRNVVERVRLAGKVTGGVPLDIVEVVVGIFAVEVEGRCLFDLVGDDLGDLLVVGGDDVGDSGEAKELVGQLVLVELDGRDDLVLIEEPKDGEASGQQADGTVLDLVVGVLGLSRKAGAALDRDDGLVDRGVPGIAWSGAVLDLDGRVRDLDVDEPRVVAAGRSAMPRRGRRRRRVQPRREHRSAARCAPEAPGLPGRDHLHR